MYTFKEIIILLVLVLMTYNTKAQNTTLFLIGDSTMSDKKKPEVNPEYGWGQVLPEFLTQNIKVENHAVNGRSSKSFIDEGRWDAIVEKLDSGDYVFIQFGHNDQKIKSPERFTNPFTGYRRNLEKFVKETKEKGAKPFLFTSIVRRKFNKYGVLVDTHGDYPLVVRLVADDLDVHFIDLQRFTEELELSYGEEESKKLHLHFSRGENDYYPKGKIDNTHLSEKGANFVANLAIQEVIQLDSLFKTYVIKDALQKNK